MLTTLSLVLTRERVGVRALGDACLPVDVRSLLTSEKARAVGETCAQLMSSESHVCTPECHAAISEFRRARCYTYISQTQRLQPRHESLSLGVSYTHSEHTLVALQGRWYGLYPASGIELVEAVYDASSGVLSGTKLTGNDFVRAGRVSWTVSLGSCKVVSSLWQGSFTPRWDACHLTVDDADHMQLTLELEEGAHEVLSFVRASLPLLLDWDEPNSPTNGFSRAMRSCGMTEESRPTVKQYLADVLHHTHGTVVLDQALLIFPLVLLGGWQLGEHLAAKLLLVPLLLAYVLVLWVRLNYLGLTDS